MANQLTFEMQKSLIDETALTQLMVELEDLHSVNQGMLEATQLGRAVNEIRKSSPPLALRVKALIAKWKLSCSFAR